MWYEEKEINSATSDELDPEEDEDSLDNSELGRIQFLAERPELADPLIWFLPQPRTGTRRR